MAMRKELLHLSTRGLVTLPSPCVYTCQMHSDACGWQGREIYLGWGNAKRIRGMHDQGGKPMQFNSVMHQRLWAYMVAWCFWNLPPTCSVKNNGDSQVFSPRAYPKGAIVVGTGAGVGVVVVALDKKWETYIIGNPLPKDKFCVLCCLQWLVLCTIKFLSQGC